MSLPNSANFAIRFSQRLLNTIAVVKTLAIKRGVAEWSNAAVLKTVVPRGTGGSNPSSSARIPEYILCLGVCFSVVSLFMSYN